MSAPESIRSWYRRTTRAALIALVWSAIAAGILSVAAFFFMPQDAIVKVQTFNGAFTVPVFGGLWIASFIFLWLNPSREVMFRSQEGMDRMEARFDDRLVRLDRVISYLEQAVDKDVLGKVERGITSIEGAVLERTKTLPTVPRRPIDPPASPIQGRPNVVLLDTSLPCVNHGMSDHLNGD
jgi:hypothetical protein